MKYPYGSSRPANYKIVLDIVKYHDDPRRVRVRQVRLPWREPLLPRRRVYPYRHPEDVGVIKYLSEKNVNDYRRQDHEYLYRRHVPLLLLRTDLLRKCTLRRYNPEMIVRE